MARWSTLVEGVVAADALGATVLRASATDVLRNPDRFAAQVRAVLRQRAA